MWTHFGVGLLTLLQVATLDSFNYQTLGDYQNAKIFLNYCAPNRMQK